MVKLMSMLDWIDKDLFQQERERVKQLLAAQEILFPHLYHSLLTSMKPLMARRVANGDQQTNDLIDVNDEDI